MACGGGRLLLTNLRGCLRDLADEQFQAAVWSGRAGGVVSSFGELVCMTFDDTGLSDLQRAGAVEQELGPTAAALVSALDAALDEVDGALPVEQLVASPPMREVRALARQLLELLA